MLGVLKIKNRYFRHNINTEIFNIFNIFKNINRIKYIIFNNAENNNIIWEIISAKLRFKGRARRRRCFSYILNLLAKALLFSSDANAFKKRIGLNKAAVLYFYKPQLICMKLTMAPFLWV